MMYPIVIAHASAGDRNAGARFEFLNWCGDYNKIPRRSIYAAIAHVMQHAEAIRRLLGFGKV